MTGHFLLGNVICIGLVFLKLLVVHDLVLSFSCWFQFILGSFMFLFFIFYQTIPGMENYADIASSFRGLPQMVNLWNVSWLVFWTFTVVILFPISRFCLVSFLSILQVIESINRCDVDIRRELFSSILVNQRFFLFLFLSSNNLDKQISMPF